MFIKGILCMVCAALMACATPKPADQVTFSPVLLSSPIKLTVPSSVASKKQKTVYILARKGEENSQPLDQALRKELRVKGYTIEQSPSLAQYVLHVNIIHMGPIAAPKAKSLVDAGYAAPLSTKSTTLPQEENTASNALIVDVLVAARTMPKALGNRPKVVTTTAKKSKVAENSGRMGVLSSTEEGGQHWTGHALGALAKEIVKALP